MSGDASATENADVTFWGAQWWKENESSTDATRPPSFKGWATDRRPGRLQVLDPDRQQPAAPGRPAAVGDFWMIVTTGVTQSGSVISGTISAIARVSIDPGYQDNPGPSRHRHRAVELISCQATGSGGGDLKPSDRSSARRRYERRAGSVTTRSA